MRILQVVHLFPPEAETGTEIYTYNLAKGLLARGHELSVFTSTSTFDHPCYHSHREMYEGIDVIRIHNRFATMQDIRKNYLDSEIERAFREHLAEFQPDVVHVQHLFGLSLSLVEAIQDYGAPIIFTLHDYWYFCPRIQLLNGNCEVCSGPEGGTKCGWCVPGFSDDSNDSGLLAKPDTREQEPPMKRLIPRGLKHRLKIALVPEIEDLWKLREEVVLLQSRNLELKHDAERLYRATSHYVQRFQYAMSTLNKAHQIITPSEFVKNKYAALGIAESRMRTITHGLDSSRFGRQEKSQSAVIRFGYFGGLFKHKGIEVLIEAFADIPSDRASLQIFGDSANAGYKHRIMSLPGIKKIDFRGSYANLNMSQLLSEIDVVVVPSIWEETFNLVVREAFLGKTAVIASRIGALAEAVTDGVDGFLVKPGCAEDLNRKIRMIISDPAILSMLRESIRPVKEISQHVCEIEEVYQEAASASDLGKTGKHQ